MPSGACCRSSARYPAAGTDTRAGSADRVARHMGADIGARVLVSHCRRANLGVARGYPPAPVPSARAYPALPRDRLAPDIGARAVPPGQLSARSPSGRLAVGACHRRAIVARSARSRRPDTVGARATGYSRRGYRLAPGPGPAVGARSARGYRRGYSRRSARGYSDQRLCVARSEFRRFHSRIYIRVLLYAEVWFANGTALVRIGRSPVLIIRFLQNHNLIFAKFCSRFARGSRRAAWGGRVAIGAVLQNNNPIFVFDLRAVITVRYRDHIK